MNIPFFNNTTIDVWAYNGRDEYGDVDYSFRETINADIQPLSPQSSMKLFGKILQDTYKIFIDENTEINNTDLLKIQDEKYEIVGSVETWNHILPFKKITIKKQRKT